MTDAIPDWKESIRNKLVDILSSDPESILRILYYLDQEDKAVSKDVSHVWKSLQNTSTDDLIFEQYVMALVEDTKTAEQDPKFRELMKQVYSEMLDVSSDELEQEEHAEGFEFVRFQDLGIIHISAFTSLASAWDQIPAAGRAEMIYIMRRIASNQTLVSAADEVFGMVDKAGGNAVMVGLAVIHLSWTAITNLRRWWKGEISGKRCVKNVMDSLLTLGAGMCGGAGGCSVGSFSGSIGTFA